MKKAVVFINEPRDKNEVMEKGLDVIMKFLDVDQFDFAIANVPVAIHRIIEEDENVRVVVTSGCKEEVQAIATKAEKLVIEYQKDKKIFSPVRTYERGDATELSGTVRFWTKQYYSLAD